MKPLTKIWVLDSTAENWDQRIDVDFKCDSLLFQLNVQVINNHACFHEFLAG